MSRFIIIDNQTEGTVFVQGNGKYGSWKDVYNCPFLFILVSLFMVASAPCTFATCATGARQIAHMLFKKNGNYTHRVRADIETVPVLCIIPELCAQILTSTELPLLQHVMLHSTIESSGPIAP